MDIFLYITISIICYLIFLLVLKNLGIWRKIKNNNCNNCCPCDKKEPLERIRRKNWDHFVNYITFQIYDFKRYKCIECAWEGRRWDKKFKSKF